MILGSCSATPKESLVPRRRPPKPPPLAGSTGLAFGGLRHRLDNTTVLIVAVPTLVRELGASLEAIQWVIAAIPGVCQLARPVRADR